MTANCHRRAKEAVVRFRLIAPQISLALFFAVVPALPCAANGIQIAPDGFVFNASNSTVIVSKTNGSILSVSAGGQPGNILGSGEFGLWILTNQDGSSLDAAAFSSTSTSNTFHWTLPSPSNLLVLDYSNAAISVTVSLSNRSDGLDFSARVQPRQKTVLEFGLPARLRFVPTNIQRVICPLSSSDGVGAAFNARFFEAQTQGNPASWSVTQIGQAGYISLYGGPLIFGNATLAPISFTSVGTNWLGSNVTAAWTGSNAFINRPPAAGQAPLTLVSSTNGAFFSADHLGGSGYLFRLGGEIDVNSEPLAEALVIGAIEHLASAPPAGRTNVALLNLVNGPASGGWASVPVGRWSTLLMGDPILGAAGIQVVEIPDIQSMLTALASSHYLAILNPYGEWTPTLETNEMTQTVEDIGDYVRAGGNWFETGGYSFYYALTPYLYYNYNVPYPPAFADFLQVETAQGNAALYGVQPVNSTPWAGSNNPAWLFVPGRLAWGGDPLGGYCERAFGTYVASGQSWQSPVARLTVGQTAPDALSAYGLANGYNRPLSAKMPASTLDAFVNSVLVYYSGDCAEKTAHLTELPSPALVHFADYLFGGFDHEYPDYLPPNAAFGTLSDFTNFLAQAHQLGLLTMPYTNPTWWPDDPAGPTFLADGANALLRNLDGSLSYELYGTNYGYTTCQWYPKEQAANNYTITEFSTTCPVDLLFEDQCGARTWQYDLNPASPTPYAYADGIASREAVDSATLPLSTEDGWDRLVNNESQFCGMCWATVPTANPPSWVTYLRDRFSPSTWTIYPVAQYIAHDKVSMILHDLGQFVTSDEVLSWTLGLGYGQSYSLSATDLDQASIRQWLLWLDRVQKSICARYVGQPMGAFSHQWGANTGNGVIQATYGPVSILANLDAAPLTTNSLTLAPFGFCATAPGMVAGLVLSASTTNSNSISFVAETNGGNAQFWVYTTGEQSAPFSLPVGLAGQATMQLDGHAPSPVSVQNGGLSVPLGMTPAQDRIEPPPALAGLAPSNWPNSKPAIGVLDLVGMSSGWTTNTAGAWTTALGASSLATQYGLSIRQINNFDQLAAALQAGPDAWFAIINPYGEVFPESGPGQWPATLELISNYVNNGGCWWETGGYSFYTASWQAPGGTAWQTETVGPSGLDAFGIPVGSGANNQPAETLTVTSIGQTIFGPALTARLQGLYSTVNRGLLRTSDDPGHITVLAGSQQDFIGAYRLGGWGYLWRVGGFYPNSAAVLPAVPAVLAYLYTNPPQPAMVSTVQYLWHGTVTFPSRATLQASAGAAGVVTFEMSNCPAGATNYLDRASVLNDPSAWQTVLAFASPPAQTNWTDSTAPDRPQAFYRLRSVPGSGE